MFMGCVSIGARHVSGVRGVTVWRDNVTVGVLQKDDERVPQKADLH
jgi:hypothetical protein